MGEMRLMGWRRALPFDLGQSFEVVIATVQAEPAFMVLQFVGSVEVQGAFEASVMVVRVISKHMLYSRG